MKLVVRALIGAVSLIAVTGCVTLPDPAPQRALYLDLRSIIETRGRIDWVVDAQEIEEVSPAIMTSACQATEADQRGLRAWIDARIEEGGGSARAVWEKSGRDLSAAKTVLLFERIRGALDYATAHRAQCPFWLEPDAGFTGVQANTDRFVIIAESMGSGQLVIQDGEALVGGTGLGRILPAYGVSDRLTIGLGFEAGVASTFPKSEGGGRAVKPVLSAGVPVLVRVLDGTFRYDLDVAAVTRATRNEFEGLRFGGRVSAGVGVATLRIAGVMPYVVAWAGYEYLAAGQGESETHIMRAGTRVGFNWDP